jgi:hypothetical protein
MEGTYVDTGPLGTPSLVELLSLWEKLSWEEENLDALIDASSGRLRELLEHAQDYGQIDWTRHPDIWQGPVISVDEASGTWEYWDYFAEDVERLVRELEAEAKQTLESFRESTGVDDATS